MQLDEEFSGCIFDLLDLVYDLNSISFGLYGHQPYHNVFRSSPGIVG